MNVLGYLITNPDYPRFGEDYGSHRMIASMDSHFEKVRDDVLLNKKDAILSLIQYLEYPDEQVSKTAYDHLKNLSGEDFGKDPGASLKWKNWLNDMTD